MVGSFLVGNALGARIGAGATKVIAEDDIKGYFAAMLLAGRVSIDANELSCRLGIEALNTVSIALIFGATVLVSTAIVLAAICALRHGRTGPWCRLVSS